MKDKQGVGFAFAWNGLKEAVKRERNFRIHLIVALLVVLISLFFQLERWEWVIIILMIQLVFVTELINSIFERMLDYLNLEFHPQIKIMKDMSASVVLVSAIASVVVGCIIFIPKILEMV